jgi:hypothetical protein
VATVGCRDNLERCNSRTSGRTNCALCKGTFPVPSRPTVPMQEAGNCQTHRTRTSRVGLGCSGQSRLCRASPTAAGKLRRWPVRWVFIAIRWETSAGERPTGVFAWEVSRTSGDARLQDFARNLALSGMDFLTTRIQHVEWREDLKAKTGECTRIWHLPCRSRKMPTTVVIALVAMQLQRNEPC